MTNVIVIGGRLTANANLTRTPNGSIICNFTIANNRKEANGEETTFMSVVIFGNYAEKMHPYLIKGVVVDVVGKLVQKEWIHEDKKIPIYKIYAKKSYLKTIFFQIGLKITPLLLNQIIHKNIISIYYYYHIHELFLQSLDEIL